MKILVIHNKYRYKGGENTVVQAEINLLENYGHTVIPYMRDSREIANFTFKERLQLLRDTLWSEQTYADIDNIIA